MTESAQEKLRSSAMCLVLMPPANPCSLILFMPIFMLLIIKESTETTLKLLGFGFRGCRGASVGIQMASLLCVLPSGVGDVLGGEEAEEFCAI